MLGPAGLAVVAAVDDRCVLIILALLAVSHLCFHYLAVIALA